MIRDRIDYTVQNLQIAKYEHMVTSILFFKGLCSREDFFQILMMINNAKTEEEYLEYIKRFVAYTKLVVPEIIELYEITEKIQVHRMLVGWDPEFDLHALIRQQRVLQKECEQYIV